jgi:hypothetical protein
VDIDDELRKIAPAAPAAEAEDAPALGTDRVDQLIDLLSR